MNSKYSNQKAKNENSFNSFLHSTFRDGKVNKRKSETNKSINKHIKNMNFGVLQVNFTFKIGFF